MRKLLVVIFTVAFLQHIVGQEVKETSGIVSMGKTPLTLLGNMVAIILRRRIITVNLCRCRTSRVRR